MQHTYFEIRNFKGIVKTRLDFTSRPQGNIYPCVGLNESGKTTILEGLNFISYKSDDLDPLHLPGYSVKDVHELIPISQRSNFNDPIAIEAGYELDEDDEKHIKKYLFDQLAFTLTRKIEKFSITQSYLFHSSRLNQPNSRSLVWDIEFWGKLKRGKAEKKLPKPQWLTAINYLKPMLPSVIYFPSFLFEFPDRIYLEGSLADSKKHEFYRMILQDVLDAIGDHTNLNEHVLARCKDGSIFDRQSRDKVLLNMGSHISLTIFKSWNRIFKRPFGNKEIIVSCDWDENQSWFLELRVKDRNEFYTISERSLGFRWFFAFLLLTQYRGFRNDSPQNVLFLFDEPASNLHSSAQAQLLESFERFPGNCSIVYTTHSHHMINPAWLENTFVVKNKALDYNDNDDDYNARRTEITLEKYREFAVNHPNQTTYFQPILDVLDFSPGKLENVPDVVMVEGKNDFYLLKYFSEKILNHSKSLNLMPGNGAGSLDTVIRLYIAWGRQFIVLLDSDQSGISQKKRYEQMFGILVQDRIFSIGDIDISWDGKEIEYLVESDDCLLIQKKAYPSENKYNKTHFYRAIQEAYLLDRHFDLTKITRTNIKKLLNFCAKQLKK